MTFEAWTDRLRVVTRWRPLWDRDARPASSARLHDLDPERYLAELIRVLPHWPAARYLELSPACWATTRARLDPAALAQELGPLAVPERPTEEEAHR